MGNLKHEMFTFYKAQMSAWVASAIDYALTILLTELCGVWYVCSTFIGALAGGVANCLINYQWVFNHEPGRRRRVALRYLVVWCVSILLNTYGTYFLTEQTGVNYIIAKAVVACAVAVLWNYQMQRLFVFK